MRPGSRLDTQPPAPPSQLTQSSNENMGYPGVELSWKAGSDNNWVCYYGKALSTSGQHRLRLEVLGQHSARAKGDAVHLDGVRIEADAQEG